MARILIIGESPLPFEESAPLHAPGARTWQFAKHLSGGGNEILVVALRGRAAGRGEGGAGLSHDGIPCRFIEAERASPDHLRGVCGLFAPDALIGIGLAGASLAAAFRPDLPLWADMDGDPLFETILRKESDGRLHDRWLMFRTIIRGADLLSVSSSAQRYILIGELATQGRLCAKNAGRELVFCIPPPADGLSVQSGTDAAPVRQWASSPCRTERSVAMAELTVLPWLLDREDIAAKLDELRALKGSRLLRALLAVVRVKNTLTGGGA
ncbi:MAG: hypothetical protein WCP22_03610 [Chlamydiota bacterium]